MILLEIQNALRLNTIHGRGNLEILNSNFKMLLIIES